MVFSSGPPFNLFRKAASGASAEERLTRSPNTQFAQDWSRDARSIVYEELTTPGNHWALWILPAAPGDRTPRPYSPSPFNQQGARISADSRWVAFQSDESGRYEVYVDGFPEPRGKVRISTGGGTFPEWSNDGRELFYLAADSMLMSVGLKPGNGSLEPSAPRALFPVRSD